MTSPDLIAFRNLFSCSQAEMAELLGVSVTQYGNWERGINHRTGKPIAIPRLLELACLAPAREFLSRKTRR